MEKIAAACSGAADELAASRRLTALLESENALLKQRLETEVRRSQLFEELARTQAAGSDALRETVKAKNDALAAKDALIAAQDKTIASLSAKKSSVWKRLGDILIGAAAGALLR